MQQDAFEYRGRPRSYPMQGFAKVYKQQQKMVRHVDSRSEMVYNLSESQQSNKSHIEEMSNYDQPTLPYYVVPVLYVPKRVLPNDEIVTKPTAKYYTHHHHNNLHKTMPYYEGGGEQRSSYYNMQYAASNTSNLKESLSTSSPAPNPQQQETSTPFQEHSVSFTKLSSNSIRPLKTHPRSSFDSSGNEYYYLDKDMYKQKQQQESSFYRHQQSPPSSPPPPPSVYTYPYEVSPRRSLGTQTLNFRTPLSTTSTQTTQDKAKEERQFSTVNRNKCNILRHTVDLDDIGDEKELIDAIYKVPRRHAKKKSPSSQNAYQTLESRMPSPTRRKKF